MTPSARIQASIELWGKIWDAGVPMDNLVGDYFRNRRYIGSGDRRAIVERIYAMMRSYARIGWHLEQVGVPDTPRMRALADLALREGVAAPHIRDLYNGAKHAPDDITEQELGALALCGRPLETDDMPDHVKAECPLQALGKLRALFGKDFTTEMAAMQVPATLDLRVNTLKTDREGALKSLSRNDVPAHPTPYSPVGIRLEEKVHLSKTKAFTDGLVEIQDEGSQLIALVCGAKPGMQVLDACAGGGGKTLALAAGMENKGRIVATDIHGHRLAKAKPRFARAGIHNIEARALDDERHRKWLRRQKESFDIVLVDAPCSSSGTWRRNPDLRWRHFGPTLEDIITLQTEILERFAKAVKVGGKLVYATCSLYAEENEQQVARFLDNHPDFEILPFKQAWAQAGLSTEPEYMPPIEGDFMRLSPLQSKTDGFFAAVLVRRASQEGKAANTDSLDS